MEQVNFQYSMKDIPNNTKKEFIMKLTQATNTFVLQVKWAAAFFLGLAQKPEVEKETFGFKTLKNPPDNIPYIQGFLTKMQQLAANIEFRSTTNNHQKKMKKDLRKMNNSNKILVDVFLHSGPVLDYLTILILFV